MIELNFNHFFDRPKIKSKIGDAARSVLSKFGSFVRTRAKRSIRTRKRKSAQPGNPPYSHVGLLRKLIFFQYEEANYGVVIGPAAFGASKRPRSSSGKTVPELLELGGKVRHWRTKKPAVYAKFPYMEPAFRGEMPKFAKMFENSVK